MYAQKAWEILKFKSPQILNSLTSLPIINNANDVLIKVKASSLNPLDVWMRDSYGSFLFSNLKVMNQLYTGFDEDAKLVLGRDFSGEIIDMGTNVKYVMGQEVWGTLGIQRWLGSQSEYTIASQNALCLKPRNLTHIQSASLPYIAMTVMSSLLSTLPKFIVCDSMANFLTRRRNGECNVNRENYFNHEQSPEKFDENNPRYRDEDLDNHLSHMFDNKDILLRAGSGGIATFFVQLAKAYKARQVVCICQSVNHSKMEELGADLCLDHRNPSFYMDLKTIGKFDLVYDAIGGTRDDIEDFTQLLKSSSKYISLSTPLISNFDRYGYNPLGLVLTLKDFVGKNIQTLSNNSTFHYGFYRPSSRFMRKLTQLVESDKINPVIDRVFEFNQVPMAYEYYKDKTKAIFGKIVITHENI